MNDVTECGPALRENVVSRARAPDVARASSVADCGWRPRSGSGLSPSPGHRASWLSRGPVPGEDEPRAGTGRPPAFRVALTLASFVAGGGVRLDYVRLDSCVVCAERADRMRRERNVKPKHVRRWRRGRPEGAGPSSPTRAHPAPPWSQVSSVHKGPLVGNSPDGHC